MCARHRARSLSLSLNTIRSKVSRTPPRPRSLSHITPDKLPNDKLPIMILQSQGWIISNDDGVRAADYAESCSTRRCAFWAQTHGPCPLAPRRRSCWHLLAPRKREESGEGVRRRKEPRAASESQKEPIHQAIPTCLEACRFFASVLLTFAFKGIPAFQKNVCFLLVEEGQKGGKI